MGISYEPLMHLLIKKGLKKTDLLTMTDITTNTLAKFAKGEPVSLEIIEKLCKALGCQPGDIYVFVEEAKDDD
jgi:DNA-binding Xre family transcriptional regulator